MPYSRVTRTSFGADAIAYVLGTANDGKGHNGNEIRNLYIGCVNMLPQEVVPFTQQMQAVWNKATERHTIQINRYTLSFSLSELAPDEPKNWGIAGVIGEEFAREVGPDNQSIICVQNDGKGEKLHVHVFMNDGRIRDGKGIESWTYHHADFKPIVDKICEQYFDLAEPEELPEKVNRYTRSARDINKQIRAANKQEEKLAEEEGREAELLPEKYIWTDDLRERIKTAAATATDEEDFAHLLRLSGVELVPCKNRKTEEILKNDDGSIKYLHPGTKRQPEYYTYELVDTTGFSGKLPMNLKLKSHKMGTNYSPETLAKLFAENAKDKQREEVPFDVLETLIPAPSTSRKPAQTPQTSTEKTANSEAAEKAKDQAAAYIFILMQQIYGWQQSPKIIEADGKERYDFDELDRQLQARNDTFEQFTGWRKARKEELEKNGEKLPAIYSNDKITGQVSFISTELKAQFLDFLDRRDHPEKYTAVQEQPEQAAPMDLHQEEQQRPAPVEPTPTKQAEPEKSSKAERERQEVEAQRSVLFEEMQRINAANEKRWREQEGEDEDTVVKS